MNRPEGISESAWEKACDIVNGKFAVEGGLFSDNYVKPIALAIQAERERAAKICETVGKRLEGREFSGTVLEVAVREAVNEATHNACVILAKHIRKGA